MKYFFYLFLLISSNLVFAQQNDYGCLVVKSEKEGPFFMYLDGIKINEQPQTCIRVIHLKQYSYGLKIVFTDTSLNTVEKQKLFICNKKGEKKEFTYNFSSDSGLLRLNFVSMLPVDPTLRNSTDVYLYDAAASAKLSKQTPSKTTTERPSTKVVVPNENASKENKELHGNYGCLIVKSEKEGPFFMYLDGVMVNDQPQSCVTAMHLEKYAYALKIVFAAKSIRPIENPRLFVCNKKGEKKEFTYDFKKEDGKLKLNFVSMLPVKTFYKQGACAFLYDAIAPVVTSKAKPSIDINVENEKKAEEKRENKKIELEAKKEETANNSEKETKVEKNIQPVATNEDGNEFGSLIVKSENEGPFYLYLDGVKINNEPQTFIKAFHLKAYSYALKIVFADFALNTIQKQKLFICNKKGEKKEFTYNFKKENDSLKLNFVSMLPVKSTYSDGENVFLFDAMQKKESNNKIQNNDPAKKTVNRPEPKQKSKADQKFQKQDSLSVQSVVHEAIKVPEFNPNIINGLVIMEPNGWACSKSWPLPNDEYNKAIAEIMAEKSSAERLKMAKSFAEKKCLKTDQVLELNMLLSNDEERLTFSKLAFKHTIDIKNYHKVTAVFENNYSKSEFIYFISH